jgi:TrfB plasmid transcriptional repressor
MTDLRRLAGTLTMAQLRAAARAFPGMSEQSVAIAQAVLVRGELQVDVAAAYGLSKERVRAVATKVLEEHLKQQPATAARRPARR